MKIKLDLQSRKTRLMLLIPTGLFSIVLTCTSLLLQSENLLFYHIAGLIPFLFCIIILFSFDLKRK